MDYFGHTEYNSCSIYVIVQTVHRPFNPLTYSWVSTPESLCCCYMLFCCSPCSHRQHFIFPVNEHVANMSGLIDFYFISKQMIQANYLESENMGGRSPKPYKNLFSSPAALLRETQYSPVWDGLNLHSCLYGSMIIWVMSGVADRTSVSVVQSVLILKQAWGADMLSH